MKTGQLLAIALICGVGVIAGWSILQTRPSAKRRAAFISGIQGVLGLLVASDVIRRFLFGSEPTSLAMISVGATALAANEGPSK